MLVVHSNPLASPGAGDAGGMTVYVRQVAKSLAAAGTEVDIYTRRNSAGTPAESTLYPGVRVIQIEAGAPGLTKSEIAAHLPEFTSNLLRRIEDQPSSLDMIHSHYWLSGRVASLLKARTGLRFVHTFHTLGRVKNHARRSHDSPEPETRLRGEAKVIADACAIVASTSQERQSLIDLYAAHPERIHVIPPGVDHALFRPGNRHVAKTRLGLDGRKVMLFVGRIQPLKAADTALRAAAHMVKTQGWAKDDLRLLIIGGSSGDSVVSEPQRLRSICSELGLAETVRFIPAQPQHRLPDYYQAADVCLVPSFTESFGLVALEAQACGLPVVGSSVGGLKIIISEGKSGFLANPGSIEDFAGAASRILSNDELQSSMREGAVEAAAQYSWGLSAEHLHDLYADSLAKTECSSAAID